MVPPVYVFLFFFFLLFSDHVLPLSSAAGACPSFFDCGNLGNLRFPFTTSQRNDCGMLPIYGCDEHNPNADKTVQFKDGGEKLLVRNIDSSTVSVSDEYLRDLLLNGSCKAFSYNVTVPPSSALGYFQIRNKITVFKCNGIAKVSPPKQILNYTGCGVKSKKNETIYFGNQNPEDSPASLAACSRVQLPLNSLSFSGDPFAFIASDFVIEVRLSDDCVQCSSDRGQCRLDDEREFDCSKSKEDKGRFLIEGLAIGFAVMVITIGLFIILLKRRYNGSCFQNQSRTIYFDTYSNTNPEYLTFNSGVHVFSYEELEEATNRFDPSRELGSGGFGTVYYGKLKDEREVAIKRLYERKRDDKHVKQFKNEIQILTRLRHRNLVTLYGCTANHSRGLLLVYEYIPNGTVGSHLHGALAKPGSLSWPVRMKIAIETASALTYLHASGIIHRDVKTNNILLDNNFCVKVADFGISRLSSNDVSHVSTAPQGTMGYIDPEYLESRKLTNKSDVYSFGVVLIELISSMPAVDDARNIDEIKLANLAIKKIQRGAFTELVDHSLGFVSNNEFKRMIVSAAELAFQCLQRDKKLRPSMKGVLEALQKIESGNHDPGHLELRGVGISDGELRTASPTSIPWDEVGFLENLKPRPNHQTL